MEAINVIVSNYKESTKGLNIFLQVLFALVLAFIFFAVVSAFVNVFITGVS